MSRPDPWVLPPGKLPGAMLERLLVKYHTPPDASVLVDTSYGFDAAAIRLGDETLLVKSDPITFAGSNAAHFLVSVNANDIACLGGTPRWMTLVALLPEHSTTPQLVEGLFADVQRACEVEGISLIGGHTEITIGVDRPLLIGTLLGTIGPYGLLKPGDARAGDELWMSHNPGIEGTALLAFEREQELTAALGPEIVKAAQALLQHPGISVSRDANNLLATGIVTALHDATEGGVATAIHEIAAASGLGAAVDGAAISILPETAAITTHFGLDPLGLISSGALLIATTPGRESLLNTCNVPLTRIGVLTDQPGRVTISTERGEQNLQRFDSDELARALAT